MPDRGFKTITVTTQLYDQVKKKAKREKKSAAGYVSEILLNMLYVDERFSNYVPLLELVALEANEVIIRDNKKDRVVEVRAKRADDGKLKLYCALDNTDYCPHTAFAGALPQVINAVRR
ncbi:MAG: hypothetical protein HY247_08195 [archaeon]|nr:MAG: hypothetical protein HY247_08195 [archaeon]